ncbi:MAG: sensor domain-containing diguanylate cyclase [Thermoanaerobacterales bacterium]|nr:sensor domain-containing diguanylate cyclase [Bacillota bacterium]MDI6907415.1 sensor domain-containing diguanylate cyclase [Thermoanaerobacterales bacterium]
MFRLCYVWAVIGLGLYLLIQSFPALDLDLAARFGALVLLGVLAEWLVVSFPHGQLSSGFAVVLATFLVFGPAAAMWVNGLATLVGQGIVNRGNSFRTTLFNAAQHVLAVSGGAWTYAALGGGVPDGGRLAAGNIVPLLGFAAVYFALNHLLVYFYLHPRRRAFPSINWPDTLRWDAALYLFALPVAALMAYLYRIAGETAALLFFLPILALQLFLRRAVRLELTNRELTVLYEVAKRLGTSLHVNRLIEIILSETRRILPYHTAAVFLWDEERELFHACAVRSPYADDIRAMVAGRDEGVVGWAAERKEPAIVEDARDDPRFAGEPGLAQFLRSLITIPLMVEDEVLGVFLVGDRRPGAYDRRNLHVLTIIGGQAAVAIYNALLCERTARLASRDPLTGLANRHQFMLRARAELDRAREEEEPLSLLLLELMNLAEVNARYGQAFGDRVLVQAGRMLTAHLPATAVVARYGGRVFAALLPGVGEVAAAETATGLARALEQRPIGDGEGHEVLPAVAAAAAALSRGVMELDDLLAAAEEALRHAADERRAAAGWTRARGARPR